MSRTSLALALIAAASAMASAGPHRGARHRHRPTYAYDAVVRDSARYHLITYCVERPGAACPARVPPPWRPAGEGAPDLIERDDTTGASRGKCCYAATWGKAPPVHEPPERGCDQPSCHEHDL